MNFAVKVYQNQGKVLTWFTAGAVNEWAKVNKFAL